MSDSKPEVFSSAPPEYRVERIKKLRSQIKGNYNLAEKAIKRSGTTPPCEDALQSEIASYNRLRLNIATEITRARAEEQAKAEQDKSHDKFGLYSETYFMDALERQRTEAIRHNQTFSILILDLDSLKATNDKYGHQAGDNLLKQFSDIIKANIREEDTGARLHGDEFSVLLPATNGQQGIIVAERIRKFTEELLANNIRSITNEPDKKFTTSIGVLEVRPEESLSVDEILHKVDTAMLNAKYNVDGNRKVGNRVVVYNDKLQNPSSPQIGR